MYLSNSSKMEDQIAMAFSGVMDEAMSILEVEEAADAAASLSIRWPKHRQRYVNCDHEVTHFRLRHNYFDDGCMYHPLYFHGDIVCGGLLS
jgi:hypothetical protein